jgi:hypothetical protein
MIRIFIDIKQVKKDIVEINPHYDSSKYDCTDLETDSAEAICKVITDMIDEDNKLDAQEDIDDILNNIGKNEQSN